MKTRILDIIDFEKVNTLLEGFNQSTGFVTAILDLDGNILSKSGWRQMCTDFHRINPKTSKKCIISDTELAGKLAEGEKYHFYKCLNGLVDVAVPIVINGEHIANLFSGQFLFEEPDRMFFKKQADKYGFNEKIYMEALEKVPVVSKEKVLVVMDFLLNMTQLISEMTFQKLQQTELNNKLRESERHLRNTQNIAHVGSWHLDVATNQVIWTDELYKMYGFDPALPPPPYTEHMKLFTPESWEMLSTSLAITKETGTPYELELQTVKKNGSNGWMWVRGEVVKDLAGNTIGLWGAAQDITKRKESELEREHLLSSEKAALAEANKIREQLSQILERISDGFGSLDKNWCYTFVNERLAQTVERRREDLVGRNIWMEFPEAVGTPVHQAYIRAMTEQVTIELEHYYTPLDRWFQHRFYPSSKGLSVFSRDITERKKTEEALHESYEKLKKVLEVETVGVMFWDLTTGCMIDANDTFLNMMGYSHLNVEARELTWQKLTPPEYLDVSLAEIRKFQVSGRVGPYEKEYLCKDGTRKWFVFAGSTLGGNTCVEFCVDISDRKKTEAALRESEERYRTIVSNIPGGLIHIFDKNMRYIFNAGEELTRLGLSNESLVGKSIHEVLPLETAKMVEEYYKRVLVGETVRFEGGFGEEYFSITSAPLRNTNGEIENILTLSVNITERKRTEQNLAESEKRYRSLFENMTAGFVLFEVVLNENGLPVDLIVLAGNESFEATTGLTLMDAIGKHLTNVLPGIEKDAADWIGKYAKVALTGEPKKFEQGSELLGVYYSVTAYQSGPKQCAVIFEDITERKRVEKELVESEERFRKVFEEGQLGMVIASLKTGNFLSVNKAFCEMLGFSEEELSKHTFMDVTYPDDRANDIEAVRKLLEGQIQKYNTEKRYKKKNGEVIWANLSVSKIYNNKDQSYYALGMIEDITMRKMAEEEIAKLNAGLEMKVKQRTLQLETANKELETFTYSVSHDLKAPLRGIDGYSKLLLDLYKQSLNEEAQTFIETIRSSTLQMNQLIDDLLNYSRLERSQLSIARIKIKDLIKSVLSIYNADFKAGNFKININIADIELIADSKGLTIALRNLLENAIKFTKGKAEPSIEIEVEEKKLSWIIRVKDNGIGFDMQYHQKIFEIFQRLQRVEDFPGTGIGLAMVSKAMHRMHGRVWAESTLGMGSTFYLEIPKNQ